MPPGWLLGTTSPALPFCSECPSFISLVSSDLSSLHMPAASLCLLVPWPSSHWMMSLFSRPSPQPEGESHCVFLLHLNSCALLTIVPSEFFLNVFEISLPIFTAIAVPHLCTGDLITVCRLFSLVLSLCAHIHLHKDAGRIITKWKSTHVIFCLKSHRDVHYKINKKPTTWHTGLLGSGLMNFSGFCYSVCLLISYSACIS